MKGFGKRIKTLRLEKELTQSELAKHLEISSTSIGSYEKEKRIPRDDLKIKIAKFFNVKVSDIFFTN